MDKTKWLFNRETWLNAQKFIHKALCSFIFLYLFKSEYLINVILFNKQTKEFVYLFLMIYFLTIYVNKQKIVAQACVYKRRPIV